MALNIKNNSHPPTTNSTVLKISPGTPFDSPLKNLAFSFSFAPTPVIVNIYKRKYANDKRAMYKLIESLYWEHTRRRMEIRNTANAKKKKKTKQKKKVNGGGGDNEIHKLINI